MSGAWAARRGCVAHGRGGFAAGLGGVGLRGEGGEFVAGSVGEELGAQGVEGAPGFELFFELRGVGEAREGGEVEVVDVGEVGEGQGRIGEVVEEGVGAGGWGSGIGWGGGLGEIGGEGVEVVCGESAHGGMVSRGGGRCNGESREGAETAHGAVRSGEILWGSRRMVGEEGVRGRVRGRAGWSLRLAWFGTTRRWRGGWWHRAETEFGVGGGTEHGLPRTAKPWHPTPGIWHSLQVIQIVNFDKFRRSD